MKGDMARPTSPSIAGWEGCNEVVVTMTSASKIVQRVVTIDENKSVLDAAKLMTEEFIGSVVVTHSSGIRGLFTERELVMTVVGKEKDLEKVQIKDVMTSGHLSSH